jgi:hypothetical protein
MSCRSLGEICDEFGVTDEVQHDGIKVEKHRGNRCGLQYSELGLPRKEFKCQGVCQTDWRQIWERGLSVGLASAREERSA